MFKIIYYRKFSGESPVRTFIESLRITPGNSAQVQYRQIMHSNGMLETAGTRLGERHTKHLEDGIWELRPGCNRVLVFLFRDDTFILLHAFPKKKREGTPIRNSESQGRAR